MWEVGDRVYVGWPDHQRRPAPYEVIEVDRSGPVVRVRVQDGSGRQGGFLVILDFPDDKLDFLAEEATRRLGYEVTAPDLRCSLDGKVLRSFDYEWWPTPEYKDRPRMIVETLAKVVEETGSGDEEPSPEEP